MKKLPGEEYFNLHILTCVNGHFYSKKLTIKSPKIYYSGHITENISAAKYKWGEKKDSYNPITLYNLLLYLLPPTIISAQHPLYIEGKLWKSHSILLISFHLFILLLY